MVECLADPRRRSTHPPCDLAHGQACSFQSDHVAHTAHGKPLARHPNPFFVDRKRDHKGARRGLVTRAASSRNGGRHQIGIVGGIISEYWAVSIGISTYATLAVPPINFVERRLTDIRGAKP